MKNKTQQAGRNEEVSPVPTPQESKENKEQSMEFDQRDQKVNMGQLGDTFPPDDRKPKKEDIPLSEVLKTDLASESNQEPGPVRLDKKDSCTEQNFVVPTSQKQERISQADAERIQDSPTVDTTKGEVPWKENKNPKNK